MRADIHGGPEHTLQSEAGYIDARPKSQQIDENPLATRGRTREGVTAQPLPASPATAAAYLAHLTESGLKASTIGRRLAAMSTVGRVSSAAVAPTIRSPTRQARFCLSHNRTLGTEHEVCEHEHVTQHNQGASDGDGLQFRPAKKDRRNSAGQDNRPANPDTNLDERGPARIKGRMKPVENSDEEE
jgi:hypothetical protein